MPFDMNRTWSQAVAMLRANVQLLALIAGMFTLLPTLLVLVALPTPGPEASPATARAQLADMTPATAITYLAVVLVSFVGYSAMVALMGPRRPTVGAAIARGFKSLPSLVAALVLFAFACALVAMLLGALMGALLAAGGSAGQGLVVALMETAALIGALYLFTRLVLTLPVIVLDGVFNPAAALVRSWRLTAHSAWRIFGFLGLLFVVYMVVVVLLSIVGTAAGLIGGEGLGIFLFGLLSGVVGMVVAMLASAVLVSMHQQLSGKSRGAAADTAD